MFHTSRTYLLVLLLTLSLPGACLLAQVPTTEPVEEEPLTFWERIFGREKKNPRLDILFEFPNGKFVTREEFEWAYLKQHNTLSEEQLYDEANYRAYLQQYVDFTRKVMAAEAVGLDQTEAFQQEYQQYVNQLAQSFLAENRIIRRLVEEAYERSKYEVSARHILVQVPEYASPADTLYAYQKALALRDSLIFQAVDFEQLARRHSADPSAQRNGGDLGYFTVFQLVYPLETAAYTLAPGLISEPIRTRYGYHIMQVHDMRKRSLPRRAAHIFIRNDASLVRESDRALSPAKALVDSLYAELEAGVDFAKLAERHSQDPYSASNGGLLPPTALTYELADASRELEVGQYSQPFSSPRGWHILKLVDEQKFPNYNSVRDQLAVLVRRDGRANMAIDELVIHLKDEYKFKVRSNGFSTLYTKLGARYSILHPKYLNRFPQDFLRTELFKFADQDYTIGQFLQFNGLRRLQQPEAEEHPKGANLSDRLMADINTMARAKMLEYEESQLWANYPEFRALTREYHNGILLFMLTEQRIWQSAGQPEELKAYYEAHKNDYQAGPQVRMARLLSNDSTALAQLASGNRAGTEPGNVQMVNYQDRIRNNGYRLGYQEFIMSEERGNMPSELSQMVEQGAGWCSPITRLSDGSYTMECIVQVLHKGGPLPLELIRSRVMQDYQSSLESHWLQELEEQYPVQVNWNVFSRLFTNR